MKHTYINVDELTAITTLHGPEILEGLAQNKAQRNDMDRYMEKAHQETEI